MADHAHIESVCDEELLDNICHECGECFAALFRRYFRQVVSVAFRILRDRAEAEDILQEVFLAIYLQQERFDRARGSVRTWILQFAYYKSLLRRRYLHIRNFYKQEELSEGQHIRMTTPSEWRGMDQSEWACCVEKGIAALNAKQRKTIELVHMEGYTLEEAAKLQGEHLANTRNNYYRGLKALRTFLGAVRKTAILKEGGGLKRVRAI